MSNNENAQLKLTQGAGAIVAISVLAGVLGGIFVVAAIAITDWLLDFSLPDNAWWLDEF